MPAIIKRYAVAFGILFFIVALMVLGTMAVKSFGDNMFEGTGIKITPQKERLQ